MKKMRKLAAVFLALALLAGLAGTTAAQEDQDAYWDDSGRGALYDIWYYGRGTTLSPAERDEFFQQQAEVFRGYNWEDFQDTAVQMLYAEDMTGSFIIYPDGFYTGHVGYYLSSGEYMCTEFQGSFSNVVRLTPYVYALESYDTEFYAEDVPEAMQSTMILTLPGIQAGMEGALKYEIQAIADRLGLNRNDPLPCYFLTAFDSGTLWYSDPMAAAGSGASKGYMPAASSAPEIYGLTVDKLATRKGPGTQYDGGGTYNVKGEYIKILTRAYDKRNGIWWVKCEIPYKGEIRVLWTGWKRFDHDVTDLESIPVDPDY